MVFLDARKRVGVVHEVGEADEHGREADEAVQNRDELGHLRHLHAPREHEADAAADEQRADQDARSSP